MKRTFLCLFLGLVALPGFTQIPPVDDETGLFTYKEVITQTGTKEILYDRGLAWVRKQYRNPSEVLGQRSPEEGFITGKANIRIHNVNKKGEKTPAGLVTYQFRIEFKENRYRYVFFDFQFKADSKFPLERWINETKYQTPAYQAYLEEVNKHIEDTIESLLEGMKPVAVKKDEW